MARLDDMNAKKLPDVGYVDDADVKNDGAMLDELVYSYPDTRTDNVSGFRHNRENPQNCGRPLRLQLHVLKLL